MKDSYSQFARRFGSLLKWSYVAGVCLVTLATWISPAAYGQFLAPTSTQATPSQPAAPPDALGRTTPRGTAMGFLLAARRGDDLLAAKYLDTRLQGKAAADLAHQLYVVLDRRLPARRTALSDAPEGSLSDPLRPDLESLGMISTDQGTVEITLERVRRGKLPPLWLFSKDTLDSIPDIYAEIDLEPVDEILPGFLVNTRFAGIVLFEWLAVFVGIPLFFLLAGLANRIASPALGPILKRRFRIDALNNPQILPPPVQLLVLVVLIRSFLGKLDLPLLARQFWLSFSTVCLIAGCVWASLVLNGWIERHLCTRFSARNEGARTLVLRFARRTVDVLIILGALLLTLYHFGVNLTATLAGLGVGGIAVALAAQKTLENVIGGISVIADRAMKVGDVLRVGDVLGTVDDIGFRSTCIRTLDRSVVRVPNGLIANVNLENLSLRDKCWLHPTLTLRYGTSSQQMRVVLDSIRQLLSENPAIERDTFRVRFTSVGPYSLHVDVFAYVLTRDWNHFLEIQEALLLRMMECVEAAGLEIALPSQTVFLSNGSSSSGAPHDGANSEPEPDQTIELAAKPV